jgi:HK97 family phage prohead protease
MQSKHITTGLEIKSLNDGGYFEGYASVFGVQDSDGDVIVKGAFSNTLASGKKPKMLWQHDAKEIIGKWTELSEDDNGLWVKGSLIMDTQRGREAYAQLKAGVLHAMSVGFNILGAGQGQSTRGRVIDEVDLWEISLVTWGANPEALITNVKSIRDFERFLRDAGYSRKQAAAITAGGYKAAFGQCDADSDDDAAIQSLTKLTATLRGLSHG